eukprot:10737638-Prorocentrum_lima.AAC.1
MTNIVSHLKEINRLRTPASRQFSEDSIRKKFLSLISFPEHLRDKAREELQRPSYKENRIPSLKLTVAAFDELWRHDFKEGKIKYQAPPQKSKG